MTTDTEPTDAGPGVDLGDISERGCAAPVTDLDEGGALAALGPPCLADTGRCVDECADDEGCEEACIDADPNSSDEELLSLTCNVCWGVQGFACLDDRCHDEVAQLGCCVESFPWCADDRRCPECARRWERYEACAATVTACALQSLCFADP
ncbi:MAG: hypothetical protein GWO04_44505 [Actinobacteria bacterium]|nr:hypothetical protein [Actinomycetota bacterium]NIW33020.1 hypothetical protein [Actinomycetota bacterium]